MFICAGLEWVLLGLRPSEDPISTGVDNETSTTPPQFELEITLLKDVPIGSGLERDPGKNRRTLKDEAFLPKKFIVTLQKGEFWPPSVYEVASIPSWVTKCSEKITFDESPCASPEEWRRSFGEPGAPWFWDCKEFVRGEIPNERDCI